MHRLLEIGYVWANDHLGEVAGNLIAWAYWAAPAEWVAWAWAVAMTVIGLTVAAGLRRRRGLMVLVRRRG
jgi:hypothetical protein